VLSVGRKNGKGLHIDTPVSTLGGWRKMGDLRVGDYVFGSDGKPTRVEYVSPVHIGLRCWRLTFSDGSEIVADEQHQWLTRHREGRWKTGVVTTPYIANSLMIARPDGKREHNHKIECGLAIQNICGGLAIDPYVLGVWLGNGSRNRAEFTMREEDFPQMLAAVGGGRVTRSYGNTVMFWATGTGLQASLRRLGVLVDKHIPQQYFDAGTEQRWALLQGLMDTDGTVHKHAGHTTARASFTTTTKALVDGVWRLARSLGLKATKRQGIAKYEGKITGPRYEVSFTASKSEPIFRLARKQSLLPDKIGKRSRSLAITACDEVASVPTVCIQVAAPNKLFLVGHGCVPTHNTQLAAGLALAHLCGPEVEPRGEVYSCANDRAQASKIFQEMCALIKGHEYLRARCNILQHSKTIIDLETDSVYVALSREAKTKFGLSPSFVIYDELGSADDRSLFDAMNSAMGSRVNPLMLIISTQAAEDIAPMSQLVDYGIRVKNREITDPTFHLSLYTSSLDDDPWSSETWRKANPAMGIFRSTEDIERQAQQAQKLPSLENAFRNLILNQRVAAEVRFMERAAWKACGAKPEIPDGAKVHLALDLGSTRDMSALVMVHKDYDQNFHVIPFYWLPGDVQARTDADRVPYDVWARKGLLTPIGESTDPAVIARKIAELNGRYRVLGLAFDRWRIADLKREMNAISCPVQLVEHGQGYKDMSPAVDILERLVVQKRIRHGNHGVLTWNAYNAVVVKDPAGSRKLDKSKSVGRIDGLVALAMAFSLALLKAEPEIDVRALIG